METGEPPHARYADAILAELAARAPAFPGERASIYFGGGTPSLWHPDELARVIAAARAPTIREVTLEANPVDVTDDNLRAWRAAGIDRLSIGVQSRDPEELVILGRDHRFGDGPTAVARALAAGFTVSADFILGTPHSRAARVPEVIDGAHHLSIYELTIEERTAFGARARTGTLVPRDPDELADIYERTHAAMIAAGYEHYEISSYARPGKRAIHNGLYWQGAAFLGIGVGAASLELRADGTAVRATNPRRAEAYFAGAPPDSVIEAAADEHARDRAWLAMRTADGAPLADLPAAVATRLVDLQLAERRGDRLVPTLRGFLMNDRIAAMIAAG